MVIKNPDISPSETVNFKAKGDEQSLQQKMWGESNFEIFWTSSENDNFLNKTAFKNSPHRRTKILWTQMKEEM